MNWLSIWAFGWLALAGCNQNPYLPPTTTAWQQQAVPPYQSALNDLNRRATSLDENNRDLHAQLAQSRQQVQVLRDQVALLQKQVGETAQQLQTVQVAKDEAEKKYKALEASTTRHGGAIITANNSLRQTLRVVEIPGLAVRPDGDSIRIALPVDQLFAPGTAQLVGSAFPILDGVAAEIARNYPRQVVGIEGHTDSVPLSNGIGSHQLAAAQAMAVFDQLTKRNRMPSQQFFVAAQGANRPLVSNGTQVGQAQNRRVEVVIFPETMDAR
jgi:chemotaxis protein MotB